MELIYVNDDSDFRLAVKHNYLEIVIFTTCIPK